MAKFDIRDWRRKAVLNESTGFKSEKMTESERKSTLEAVSRFNEYGKQIYKTQEIAEMVKNIKELSENASKMVMQEQDDWFDSVSVKRDTKSIAESVKVFEGAAKEMSTLQQRLESVFEDIGQKLGKYYEINDVKEAMDAVGKEDGDIDNDGDEDGSDEYLAKKRAAISKAVKNENKFQSQVNEAFEGLSNVVTAKKIVVEEKYVVVDPRGNARPVGSKMQGSQYSKKMGGPKKGYHIVLAKNALKARRAIEKNRGNSTDSNIQDLMFDLMYEGTIAEGFATWKMSFADMDLSGVKLRKSKTYTVKARSTVEAIKKASKMAGLSGNDWMATQTHKLEKVG